jgi:hypothetical protein
MLKKYKILKAKRLLAQIDEYGLDVPVGFSELTIAYIAENYNGAGPDWMPEKQRGVITWLLSIFEPAFLIHDMEFAASNHTERGFAAANNRMWRNIRKIINEDYPLSNPLCWVDRCRWWARGRTAYIACAKFGRLAWMD